MTELRIRMMQDMRIRNYSLHTHRIYIDLVARFAKHFKKSPDQLGPEDIRAYQVFLLEEKKASVAVLTQSVCALRFLYKVTLGRDWPVEYIPYPKQPKKLPLVLSREQVARLIESVVNLKHKTILMTIYSGGLRVSELTRLQVGDIDSERMMIFIRQGKGKKDRLVPLSPILLKQLRTYWIKYRPPKPWLFPGEPSHRPLNRFSIALMVKAARSKARLSKGVSPHTLRHCFASHLLESGVDIRTIQILLGHTSVRSTQVYTHVSRKNVLSTQSPLDLLPVISSTF